MEGGSSKWQCPFNEKAIKEIYQNYDHQKFLSWLENPVVNYSLGCMFGSFIGDALGSYLEFSASINSDLVEEGIHKLDLAMTMRAGGPFNLRAGQVTDDSEMSFHLLASLSHYDPLQLLSAQRPQLIRCIAQGYVAWKNSKPFDIGNTCRSSILVL
jgi:ADP-ribosyl-[dinitrogen reductase] hydrolase